MTRVTPLIHDAGKYLLISVYPLPTHPTHNFTHKNGGNLDTLPGWPRPILTQGTLVPYHENEELLSVSLKHWHRKCDVRLHGWPSTQPGIAHSRAPLFTQPCPHCSHSRAPGEQWARQCVFTLHGCVQAARLCRGSPVDCQQLQLMYQIHQVENDNDYT